ncbi:MULTISPECIES: RNA polymerase sigma factor [Rahnella]|uniref:RNA polymerase sigma factor n=1 Tax=Rahnella TaxID=34037 RepID=UPI00272DC90C|nr:MULTISPECIES: sigma-70 family RNA polymerase sigma factor [Rahnella]
MSQCLARLWRYAMVLSRKPDVADDLVQSTCVRALERCAQVVDRAGADRWFFSILHSIWVNELRAQHVRQGQGFVDVSETDVPADAFSFEDRHWHTQVMQRVNALPEAQRNAVFLVYVEGFTYQEAAMTLSVPIGTIMSRLAAARLSLAKDTGSGAQPQQGEKK